MKRYRITPIFWAYAALALMTGMVSTGVSANTITMANYDGVGNTVTCNGIALNDACGGFIGSLPLGPIDTSPTDADNFDKVGNPTNELKLLNDLLALFAPARVPPDVTTVHKIDVEDDNFMTSLQYFSIKKGQYLWYFENLSGGDVAVNLAGSTEDYSHWTEYGGSPSPVPVPAAVWLFGTALVGFIGISRRRKVA